MTYNVKSFDLYNWSQNVNSRDEMMDIIKQEAPDVLCLQEFFTRDQEKMDNLKRVINLLEENGYHYHFEETIRRKEINYWGLATFSRFPITGKGRIPFEGEDILLNGAMYSDLDVNGKTIRVYNVHLQSIHFRREDYAYIEQFAAEKVPEMEGTRKIAARLKWAFQKRAVQAKDLAERVEASPHPVIVCGDLNDPPVSYTYQVISNGLTDPFQEVGNGIGKTYKGPFPSFRIDHILVDESIIPVSYRTIPETWSDHYPVVGEFYFKP
jgi:endonuclease/exonuclease/phosphatase family metal-dependent hydrolase